MCMHLAILASACGSQSDFIGDTSGCHFSTLYMPVRCFGCVECGRWRRGTIHQIPGLGEFPALEAIGNVGRNWRAFKVFPHLLLGSSKLKHGERKGRKTGGVLAMETNLEQWSSHGLANTLGSCFSLCWDEAQEKLQLFCKYYRDLQSTLVIRRDEAEGSGCSLCHILSLSSQAEEGRKDEAVYIDLFCFFLLLQARIYVFLSIHSPHSAFNRWWWCLCCWHPGLRDPYLVSGL